MEESADTVLTPGVDAILARLGRASLFTARFFREAVVPPHNLTEVVRLSDCLL